MNNFKAIYIVTCHTGGCENAEIPITVTAEYPNHYVVCGPCSLKIEDVQFVELIPYTEEY